MKKYSIITFLLFIAFGVSTETQAYFTTDQEAYRINDQLALFQIDFGFGLENNEVFLPVRAARDQEWGTENTKIGFEILKNGKVTSEGVAAGFVKGPIVVIPKNSSNEQYVVPEGMSFPMSLFVVLEVEPSATTSNYRVQVTDLPFYVGEDREYQKLNPSELQYYRTPSINLNRSIAP